MVDTVSSPVKWQLRLLSKWMVLNSTMLIRFLHHLWAPSKQRYRTDVY